MHNASKKSHRLFAMATKRGYGQMIKAAREAVGVSQEDLAAALELPGHQQISRAETERLKGPIPPDLFNGITNALRAISPIELLRAMGYEIVMPPRDRVIPPDLVQCWIRLDESQKTAVLQLAHGLLGESYPMPGKDQ